MTDLLEEFAGGDWAHLAQDGEQWAFLEEPFAGHDLPKDSGTMSD